MDEHKKLPLDIKIFDDSVPPPEQPLDDLILIIHSVESTDAAILNKAVQAINAYRREDHRTFRRPDAQRYVRTRADKFEIPATAAAGRTLGGALFRHLKSAVGAIAFIDDLRPNIAYEVGFFHGKGVPVLLLSSGAPHGTMAAFSDLCGSPIRRFTAETLAQHIREYLDQLFNNLERRRSWPTYELPCSSQNMLPLRQLRLYGPRYISEPEGTFGPSLKIFLWDQPLDVMLKGPLSAQTRFKIALRSSDQADYAVYFQVSFRDLLGEERQMWLALSSWITMADFRSDERNLPAARLKDDWHYITGTFGGLLRQGYVSATADLRLERVRFRTGKPHSQAEALLEIGYLNVDVLQD
jgi:hypothetical protein